MGRLEICVHEGTRAVNVTITVGMLIPYHSAIAFFNTSWPRRPLAVWVLSQSSGEVERAPPRKQGSRSSRVHTRTTLQLESRGGGGGGGDDRAAVLAGLVLKAQLAAAAAAAAVVGRVGGGGGGSGGAECTQHVYKRHHETHFRGKPQVCPPASKKAA